MPVAIVAMPVAIVATLVAIIATSAATRAATAPAAATGVIVAFGDSLTAGDGVAPDEAYPALLQARLSREHLPYRVVNAGVSGDTTAGASRRVDWVLRTRPEIVIVALGAKDGLRGQSVTAMRDNLESIVRRLEAVGARVLLTGMRVPPNYGDDFTRAFAAVFPKVARATHARLMPFLLQDVAVVPELNQPDGIHPSAAGHRIIADRLWPYLKPMLRRPEGVPAVERRPR